MDYKPDYPEIRSLTDFLTAPFGMRSELNMEYEIQGEPTPYEHFISWGATGYSEYYDKAMAYERFRTNQRIFGNKKVIWGWYFINALYYQIIKELKTDKKKLSRFKKEIGLFTYFVISLTVPFCLYIQTMFDLEQFEL